MNTNMKHLKKKIFIDYWNFLFMDPEENNNSLS